MEPFSIFHPDNVGCSELSPGSGLWSSKVPLRARLMIPGKAIASTTILNWSIGNTESRQANFSLVKMVMPIAGNDGPMGPGPLGPWALAHWPMGPGPLGPGPWALAHWPMGPGPWALAHWAHGPWPIGPWPIGASGGPKISIFQKVWEWLPLVWKMSGYLGGVFLSYLEPPNSHIVKIKKHKKKIFCIFVYPAIA